MQHHQKSAPYQKGQSLIESCIVIGILCLLLMGIFQLSQLFMAQEILHYAAGRGARAKVVGFNDFMVFKTVRVGTIADAGPMTSPENEGGPPEQRSTERSRIPLYLGSDWSGQLPSILDYADWGSISYSPHAPVTTTILHFQVFQDFPLRYAFHRAFYADDSIFFIGNAYIDNHCPLYLDMESGGEP